MRSRLVVDACAAIHIVSGQDKDDALLHAVRAASVAITPMLFSSEVANGLSAYAKKGIFTTAEVIDRYGQALDLIDDVVADAEFGTEALSEAVRIQHPAYDLIYAILARRTGSALLTCDRRLAELASELGIPLALPS